MTTIVLYFIKYCVVTCHGHGVKHGSHEFDQHPVPGGGYPIGTTATYYCGAGSSQGHVVKIKCQNNGGWSGSRPKCSNCLLLL